MSTTHGAVLVSGASRGLGAVIARRLAADGWPVAVNYRSELERDEAGHVVEDILAGGGTAEAFAADITDETAAAGLVSRATDRLGSIDVLVVNATGPQPVVPLEELSCQDPTLANRSQTEFVQVLVHYGYERSGGAPGAPAVGGAATAVRDPRAVPAGGRGGGACRVRVPPQA
jgi:NAD(P)-dependent dehydrogenase (short-subunit alcohol dehydrogenase family)